ncbi:MAG: PQQ-binding-like beta-propeller repeat protein [Deltaproteobacteria bacterium]|nr:PQQ-binding-like beta-propeller repeat protein [Deltaproteobacteria bacterium]
MKNYFNYQVQEISVSRALRIYGAALSGTLVVTAIAWWGLAPNVFDTASLPLCWPQFPFCTDIRMFWSESVIKVHVLLIAVFGLLGVGAFFKAKSSLGYWALTAGTVLKVLMQIQDFRFMGNYHYMPYWLIAIFLFLPHKRTALPWMIVAFYISAGSLKFNREWLSGATLLRQSFIPLDLMGPLLLYAIVQECIIVFGLVSRFKWFFRFAFFNFIAFHLFSWHIVGWFYPVIMFLVLSIFPLVQKESGSLFFIEDLKDRSRSFPKSALAALLIFAAINIYPHLLPGEAALTGNGRMMGLNMLDVMPSCRHTLFLRYNKDGRINETVEWTNSLVGLAPRIKCDPIVFWNLAKEICQSEASNKEFLNLDMALLAKRQTDGAYRRIFAVKDFCTTGSPPNVFFPTPWVLQESETTVRARELTELKTVGPAIHFDKIPFSAPETKFVRQFRENHLRDGVDADPTAFDVRAAKVLWRQPIGNVGVHTASKASAIADASGVYIGSDSSWFFKFSHDGDLLWRIRLGPADRGVHSTAALDDQYVYVGNYAGTAYALDKFTGKVIWVTNLGDTIGSSFLLDGKFLYVSVETFKPNGYLVQLDRATGELRWASRLLGEQGHSSPALHRESGLLFAGFNNFLFYAIKATSGEIAWKQLAQRPIKSTPLVFKDQVVVSSSDGWIRSYEVFGGKTLWETKVSSGEFRSSPTLESTEGGGTALISSSLGEIISINLKDGKIARRHQSKSKSQLIGSPLSVAITGGRALITGCELNAICAFGQRGNKLNEWKLNGATTGQPARFANSIYVVEDANGEDSGDLVKIGVPE